MSTIDNKSLIDNLIANEGYFEGDPRVAKIVEYTNANGNITYGVTWVTESRSQRDRYLIPSEFVKNPRLIWEAKVY